MHLEFTESNVRSVLEQLEFSVSHIRDRVYRAEHVRFWDFIFRLDQMTDELRMVTFFSTKEEADRVRLLSAINDANRRASVCTFRLDDDNDVEVLRCLPCRDGFLRSQLVHLVKDGSNEIANCIPVLEEFVL